MSTLQPCACGNASELELNLLSTAICISFVLYSISVRASSDIYEKGRRPHLFSGIYILAASAAIAVSTTTIILGYKHRISLDAIAAVVFAIIPGLVSFPRDAFLEVFVLATIMYLRVFPVRYNKFSYITMGRSCREDKYKSKKSFPGCSGDECNANIYIRKLMLSNKYFPRFSKWIYRSNMLHGRNEQRRFTFKSILTCLFSDLSENYAIRWNGVILDHTPKTIILRNLVPVPEQKWYLALSNSLWLVMKPWTIHLSQPGQVVCALRLVSDILSIGRLIIHCRGERIIQFVNNLNFEEDHKARVAVEICNSIIREIGLIEWGALDERNTESFNSKTIYEEQPQEMYRLILLLVVYKSNLFGHWVHSRKMKEEGKQLKRIDNDDVQQDLEYMEEGIPASWMMEEESFDGEADDTSNEISIDGSENIDSDREWREEEKQKVNRAEFVSGILRWIGWLVYGAMPFHVPHQVAQFRHKITSLSIIKKIKNDSICGKGEIVTDEMIHNQVDLWFASWKCTKV